MEENIEIQSGDEELLDRIGPLWEALKANHVEKSTYFAEQMSGRQFYERKQELMEKSNQMRIIIASINGVDAGYCVSTISADNKGEIDMLYVKEAYRGYDLGKKLMDLALVWLDGQKVKEKTLNVAEGNEEVIKFYKKFEFFPRKVQLIQKERDTVLVPDDPIDQDSFNIEEGNELLLDFKKTKKIGDLSTDVIPVAVQDIHSKELLMICYVNEEALRLSITTGLATFWSTSKDSLHIKGETSGDRLEIIEIRVNCEQNSLLFIVRRLGKGACHTKNKSGNHRVSCFYRKIKNQRLVFIE